MPSLLITELLTAALAQTDDGAGVTPSDAAAAGEQLITPPALLSLLACLWRGGGVPLPQKRLVGWTPALILALRTLVSAILGMSHCLVNSMCVY